MRVPVESGRSIRGIVPRIHLRGGDICFVRVVVHDRGPRLEQAVPVEVPYEESAPPYLAHPDEHERSADPQESARRPGSSTMWDEHPANVPHRDPGSNVTQSRV
jgi:hypothetical protein